MACVVRLPLYGFPLTHPSYVPAHRILFLELKGKLEVYERIRTSKRLQ